MVEYMKIFISKISRSCKKMMNSLSKNMKFQKMAHSVFKHISYNTWTTEKYNISFQSLEDFIVTF